MATLQSWSGRARPHQEFVVFNGCKPTWRLLFSLGQLDLLIVYFVQIIVAMPQILLLEHKLVHGMRVGHHFDTFISNLLLYVLLNGFWSFHQLRWILLFTAEVFWQLPNKLFFFCHFTQWGEHPLIKYSFDIWSVNEVLLNHTQSDSLQKSGHSGRNLSPLTHSHQHLTHDHTKRKYLRHLSNCFTKSFLLLRS